MGRLIIIAGIEIFNKICIVPGALMDSPLDVLGSLSYGHDENELYVWLTDNSNFGFLGFFRMYCLLAGWKRQMESVRKYSQMDVVHMSAIKVLTT